MLGTAHSSVSLSISSLLGWTSNPLSSDFSNQAGHAGDTCTHDPLQLPRQWQRTTPSSGEPLKRFSTPKALKQLVQNPVRATTHDSDTGGGCTSLFLCLRFLFVACFSRWDCKTFWSKGWACVASCSMSRYAVHVWLNLVCLFGGLPKCWLKIFCWIRLGPSTFYNPWDNHHQ